MMRNRLSSLVIILFVFLPAGCHSQKATQNAAPAQAQQTDFKMVDNPGGGQFAYGTLTGQTSLSEGMVNMLKRVHNRFGGKPEIGKLFQSRDGSSLATFFTLNAKSAGGKPVTGLVIVSMHKGQTPQGAAIYDFSEKFMQSEPSLLQALSAAWSGMGGTGGGGNTQQGSAPQQAPQQRVNFAPLREVSGGDQSAYITMPADWRLTGVAGGQLTAIGSHGEELGLGLLYQGISPAPTHGSWGGQLQLVCPLSQDLFTAYVNVANQVRKNTHKPPASFKLISQQQLAPDGGPVRPVQAIFMVDENDGVGPRKGSARIGAMHVQGLQTWAMTVSSSNIPEKYADAENDLLRAVVNSYHQNGAVISAEGRADLERIRQVGIQVQNQAAAADKRREASSQAYEQHRQELNNNSSNFNQHMSDLDWSSKVTQNYILDRTVVSYTDADARATLGNRLADTLIQSKPNHFEAVPNQEMIQGLDY